MTTVVMNLVPARLLENVQTAQYTSLNVKTIIDKITVTNVSLVNVALSINIVANGNSASNANLIINTRTIEPGGTYLCLEIVGHVLEVGSFISTLASVLSSLVIDISGREIT